MSKYKRADIDHAISHANEATLKRMVRELWEELDGSKEAQVVDEAVVVEVQVESDVKSDSEDD